MNENLDYVSIFKALSDNTRLKIIEMLSCGDLCACAILESFQITQPTLSYHMKILTKCGLVKSSKSGSWINYSLDNELVTEIMDFWEFITIDHEKSICKEKKEIKKCE